MALNNKKCEAAEVGGAHLKSLYVHFDLLSTQINQCSWLSNTLHRENARTLLIRVISYRTFLYCHIHFLFN